MLDQWTSDFWSYSMNKIWNSESNSMMIEWKKWIVNDSYVIEDRWTKVYF